MSVTQFHLHVRSEAARRNTSAWLVLGLVSLVFAGVFSILLVMARTPLVQELIPFINFFRVALAFGASAFPFCASVFAMTTK